MYLGVSTRKVLFTVHPHCREADHRKSGSVHKFCPARLTKSLTPSSGNLSSPNFCSVQLQIRRSRRFQPFSFQAKATPAASPTATFPLTIAEAYYALQNPAALNMRYSEAVQDFAAIAVTAYGCGYSEDMLRQELRQAIAQPEAAESIKGIDQDDCLLCVSMVWMTVMMSKSTRRWSTAKPVSEETLQLWEGFVSLIVKGYMEKRWAWFPIDRLQMELSAVTGRNERPHVVAEWARVVHTTLEQVAPQFPSQ